MYLPLTLAARKLPADAVMLVHGWAPEDGAAVHPTYDPAAHIGPSAIQAVLPVLDAYFPASQAVHAATWATEVVPIAHGVHEEAPDAAYVPAAHDWKVVAPLGQ